MCLQKLACRTIFVNKGPADVFVIKRPVPPIGRPAFADVLGTQLGMSDEDVEGYGESTETDGAPEYIPVPNWDTPEPEVVTAAAAAWFSNGEGGDGAWSSPGPADVWDQQ